ncbi:MAG: hypothetical protein LBE96_21615, partial [Kalamiella piersonii]|uniref:hypothetical protein n=1 Tax=Pantoea piersonii TaxID=2364647 RepID=UPI00242F4FF8
KIKKPPAGGGFFLWLKKAVQAACHATQRQYQRHRFLQASRYHHSHDVLSRSGSGAQLRRERLTQP